MTGLDPEVDKIIETAVIATDFDLYQIATYQATVKQDDKLLTSRMVGDFWDKHDDSRRGLMAKNSSADAKSSDLVEKELLQFVHDNFDETQPIYLAGNSVHQDRRFIAKAWPELNKIFHYRLLDVSAWKIMFEHFGIRYTKPEAHRALSDIEGSIGELEYYLKKTKLGEKHD